MKSKHKDKRDYWKPEEEQIIKEWSDKALCYQWMYARCREIYQRKNAWYTIPAIIISTVTGTANFAQDRFTDETKHYIIMGIGSMSIIAGIITTVSQFLQVSELNEGYRAATVSWNKFHNNLKTLLARHPLDRILPSQALTLYKDEFEHLYESSPPISKKVLVLFNKKFKKNLDLKKPDICSKLQATSIFSLTPSHRQEMINNINNINDSKKNTKIIDTYLTLTNNTDELGLEHDTEINQGGLNDTGIVTEI